MKPMFNLALSFLMVLAAVVPALAGEIQWKDTIKSAFDEAKKTKKILMIDVYTEWCGWCKKLDQDVYSDPKVVTKSADFVTLKLDAEGKDPGVADFLAKYPVSGYPKIWFINYDGNVVSSIDGYVPADSMLEKLNGVYEFRDQNETLKKEFEKGVYSNSIKYGRLLFDNSMTEEARKVFTTLQKQPKLSSQDTGLVNCYLGFISCQNDDFTNGMAYLAKVEKKDVGEDNYYQSIFFLGISRFYVEGKQSALKFLAGFSKDNKTPSVWKGKFEDISERMEKAE